MALQNKLREQLAQLFLESLNQDQLPWKACWQVSLPENAVNGTKYKGINALMLSFAAAHAGFGDHRWCTFRQATEKGWNVKKGAKGWPVEYWAYVDREKKKMLSWAESAKIFRQDPDYAQENLVLRSRVYTVFNAVQIEGIPEIQQVQNTSPDAIREKRDTLFRNMGLNLQEGVSQPYYAPETDTVCLPFEKDFYDPYAYACTMLHECGHATGHASRLNRDLTAAFGTAEYAKEELRAEIASAFAAQALGLQLTDAQLEAHINLHTAYIQSWAKSIQEAPEELMKAIKDAEGIANYLIERGEFETVRDKSSLTFDPAGMDNVARIDFLSTSGQVAESVEYPTEGEFLEAVKHESSIGSPFCVVLYEDHNGCTLSRDFLKELDFLPANLTKEPAPGAKEYAKPAKAVPHTKRNRRQEYSR